MRVLEQPWFPAELEIQRADALVWAPAAFRKHGVYLSARCGPCHEQRADVALELQAQPIRP
jgi:hypothetical protein